MHQRGKGGTLGFSNLVENDANNIGVFRIREQTGGKVEPFVKFTGASVPGGANKNHFGPQVAGDLDIQSGGICFIAVRSQALDDHDIEIVRRLVILADDIFHQHVGLIFVKQVLRMLKTYRRGWRQVACCLDEGNGGVVINRVAGTLCNRLVKADPHAYAVQCSHQAEANGGKPRIPGSGCDKQVLGHREVLVWGERQRGA